MVFPPRLHFLWSWRRLLTIPLTESCWLCWENTGCHEPSGACLTRVGCFCVLCVLCRPHSLCGFSVASPGLFLITNSALKFHGQNCHSWEATDEVAYSVHKTINQQLWSYLTLLSVILCKLLPKCTNVMLRGSDQLRGVRNGASLGRGHHRKQTRSSGCYHYFENTLKNWYMYVRMKWELFWKI